MVADSSTLLMKKHALLVSKQAITVKELFEWKCHKWIWREFYAGGITWKQEPWLMFGLKVWTVPMTFKSDNQEDLIIEGHGSRDFEGSVNWQGQKWRLSRTAIYTSLSDSSGKLVAKVSNAWKDSDAVAGITHHLEAEESLDPVLAAVVGGLAGGAIRSGDPD